MEVKVLKKEKNELDVEIPSLTLVEILRIYLNENSEVTFAAWKREHFSKSPILRVKTKNKDPIKVIDEVIAAIIGDLDMIDSDFKKLK